MAVALHIFRRASADVTKKWRTATIGGQAKHKGKTYGFISREDPDKPCQTVTTQARNYHWTFPRRLTPKELLRVQTFPEDYDFLDQPPPYVLGMSVPPFMMQRVAAGVAEALGAKMENPLRIGPWSLSDLATVKKNGLKVLSTFSCGGGSTMGYKLAGYDVVGAVDIDPQMMAIYRHNHRPRNSWLMGVGEFCKIPDAELPPEVFDLDVLDGSPPCSSFSMAGAREKKWGKASKFREGQAVQVLDDLFFDFIAVANRLRPKVVVAENVKGMLHGNARWYVKQIFQKFREAGYDTQLFLLNASRMGVPQRRERTFFIARRRDLNLPKVEMSFDETPISIAMATADLPEPDVAAEGLAMSENVLRHFDKTRMGKSLADAHPKGHMFNWIKCDPMRPLPTLASTCAGMIMHGTKRRVLSVREWVRGGTFPEDYDYLDASPKYVIGMSVPPFMMQRVATAVRGLLCPA